MKPAERDRKPPRVISLLTDFGLQDGFVGAMKGVILGINPDARIVDLSHDIPPWDIRAAAFVLHAAYRYFPKDAIHVCVVDPGVGSGREILIVHAADWLFMAPDNGLLSLVLAREPVHAVYRVCKPENYLPMVSGTFHGRDIFAPVAARLSLNPALSEFGEPYKDAETGLFPRPAVAQGAVSGEVVYRDHFGNLITNIREENMTEAGIGGNAVLTVADTVITGIHDCYHAAPEGGVLALVSSAGFLEIACNRDSAARRLNAGVGTPVKLVKNDSESQP